MSNPLNGIDTDRWYLVWIVVSVLGLGGAMAVKEPRYVGIAFGALLFGMGELINHPKRQSIHPGWMITNRSRSPSLLGNIVVYAGLLIAGYNGFRVAIG